MGCPRCGGELPSGALFCPSCGSAVESNASDSTTGALDLGALDPIHDPEVIAALPEGAALLVIVRGPGAGSRYLLDRDETTVGRHPEAHVFLDDITVSRRHAILERGGDGFLVRDLGSLNGTYVGGERVEAQELVSGDELQVGRFKLLYLVGQGGAR
jgi:hypothetical protein